MTAPFCVPPPCDRRRAFWATQPDCGTRPDDCDDCGVPGLRLVPIDCGNTSRCAVPDDPCYKTPRMVDNSNWVRGLALNILLTVGTRDASCAGFRPGLRGGWWAQGYVAPGYKIGSRLYQLELKGTIPQIIATVEAAAKADLQQIVDRGYARKVDVKAGYRPGGRVGLTIYIYGESDNPAVVGVAGSRIENAWIWQADGTVAA